MKVKLICIILILSAFVYADDKWSKPIPLVEEFSILKDSIAPDAILGMSVYSLKKDKFLYQINGEKLFRPASTFKLLVTATAIDTFPLDFYPKTKVRLDGELKGNNFYGNLTLIGGADPNVSGRYFDNALTAMRSWVDSLKAQGIDTISGSILIDTNFLQDPLRPSTWEKRFFDRWYGAVISALNYNDNCVRVIVSTPEYSDVEKAEIKDNKDFEDTVAVNFEPDLGVYKVIKDEAKVVNSKRKRIKWELNPDSNIITISGTFGYRANQMSLSIPVRDPKDFFRKAFIAALDSNGIVYDSNFSIEKLKQEKVFPLQPWGEFYFKTAPILSILDEINQRSQNLHAETLLRLVGNQYYGKASLENGIKAEHEFLNRIGLDTTEFIIKDGSGLSYGNRVVPNNISLLLKRMAKHPNKEYYMNSLGLPGISGASASRMRNVESAHRIRVKTGFVNNTQGLCGYIRTSDDDTLAVALYLNSYQVRDNIARGFMDTMWTRLVDLHNMEQKHLIKARKQWYKAEEIKPLQERLEFFSALQVGSPYISNGPMGEGALAKIERKPRINMDGFDCVTFIEHVMALAYAKQSVDILPKLNSIRYLNGEVAYEKRNHFFVEDWLKNNKAYVEQIHFDRDSVASRFSDKQWFYNLKGLKYNKENPNTELSFLSYREALGVASYWPLPDGIYGIGYIGGFSKLWITHTGFISKKANQKPIFRHASSSGEVKEEDWLGYLEKRGTKCKGVVIFKFVE